MPTTIALLFLSLTCLATPKSTHREHGAHVHGAAHVAIAFDGTHGSVEFESPADGVVGFEQKPKNEKQRQRLNEALGELDATIAKMIVFDPKSGCHFQKKAIEFISENGGHGDVRGKWDVTCMRSPAGTTLTFQFQKFFPKLKDVDVQILIDTLQKALEANSNGTRIELK
jgi:hypothetical protein